MSETNTNTTTVAPILSGVANRLASTSEELFEFNTYAADDATVSNRLAGLSGMLAVESSLLLAASPAVPDRYRSAVLECVSIIDKIGASVGEFVPHVMSDSDVQLMFARVGVALGCLAAVLGDIAAGFPDCLALAATRLAAVGVSSVNGIAVLAEVSAAAAAAGQ